MKNIKHYLAAILAFTIWGLFALALKPLQNYGSLDILFYRVFSCAIIMSAISLSVRRKSLSHNLARFRSLGPKQKKKFVLNNAGNSFLLTVNWFSFIYVMNHVSVRATSLAYLICPILTTLLAFFLLRERLSRLQWLAIAISCLGCLLLSYTSLTTMLFSSLIGFTYACYLVGQKQNKEFDSFVVLNLHIVLSALLLLPFYPAFSGPLPSDLKFYLYVEIIAVMYTIVPLFLNLYALSRIPSSTVGMLLYINPIIAFCLSGLVYKEPLGSMQIFAYGLIFLAVVTFNASQVFKARKRIAEELIKSP